jgi:hypothetical protein
MRAIVGRAVPVRLHRRAVPAVSTAPIWCSWKLFAGGPQDLLDARLLIAADPGGPRETVEQRLAGLPRSDRTA